MNSIDTVARFLIVFLTINLIVCHPCCQMNSSMLPRYKLMKSNARLNELILSRTVVQNVSECKKFALAKKALAFNYGLATDFYERIDGIKKEWNTDTQRNKNVRATKKMCEALECPEVHNYTMLTRDKNYKYYSTYPSSLTPGPSFTLACVPRTGMFVFSQNNLNFSQAQAACQKMNASLAHIISEERTHGLARYISQDIPTFVGLSNHNGNNIWKNEFDEPLSCFNYRAWGKEEPSHSRGCITLVKPKSGPGPFWKVVPCETILPFICEISPMY